MPNTLIIEAFRGDPKSVRNVPNNEILFIAQDGETGTQLLAINQITISPVTDLAAPVIATATVRGTQIGLWRVQLAQFLGDPAIPAGLYQFAITVSTTLPSFKLGVALATARLDRLPRIPKPEVRTGKGKSVRKREPQIVADRPAV